MSRARNIKPGFFKNDLLAECHPLARILFAGLWCEADREGRLEDRPKRLKVECLPYDDCDVDALLEELASRGFIVRYKVGTGAYIAIVEFQKHQNPHVRELASVIPGPTDAMHNLGSAKAQPRQCSEQDEHGTGPALSSFPFPDSSFQGDIEARSTLAGDCGKAMRKAGCVSINLSNPDFLAALDEGVTPKEFADATEEAKGRGISGAGLFTYAIGIARTNHAKTANQITGANHGNATSGGSRKLSAVDQVKAANEAAEQREAIAGAIRVVG